MEEPPGVCRHRPGDRRQEAEPEGVAGPRCHHLPVPGEGRMDSIGAGTSGFKDAIISLRVIRYGVFSLMYKAFHAR